MSASRPGRVPWSSARGREASCRPAMSRPRERGSPRRGGPVRPPGSACQSVWRAHSAHPPLEHGAPGSSPVGGLEPHLPHSASSGTESSPNVGARLNKTEVRAEARTSATACSGARPRVPGTALRSRGTDGRPSSKSGQHPRLRGERPELGGSGLDLWPHEAGAIVLDSGNTTGRGSRCYHPLCRSLGLADHGDTHSSLGDCYFLRLDPAIKCLRHFKWALP